MVAGCWTGLVLVDVSNVYQVPGRPECAEDHDAVYMHVGVREAGKDAHDLSTSRCNPVRKAWVVYE